MAERDVDSDIDNTSLRKMTDCRDDGTNEDRTKDENCSTQQIEDQDRTSELENDNCRISSALAETSLKTSRNETVKIQEDNRNKDEVAETNDADKDESVLDTNAAEAAAKYKREDAIAAGIDNVKESGKFQNAVESAANVALETDDIARNETSEAQTPKSIEHVEDCTKSQKREADAATAVDGYPVIDVTDEKERKICHDNSAEIVRETKTEDKNNDASTNRYELQTSQITAQLRDDEDKTPSDECEQEANTVEKTEDNSIVANNSGEHDNSADVSEEAKESYVTALADEYNEYDSTADRHQEGCQQQAEQNATYINEDDKESVISDEVLGKHRDGGAPLSFEDVNQATHVVGGTKVVDENDDAMNTCKVQIELQHSDIKEENIDLRSSEKSEKKEEARPIEQVQENSGTASESDQRGGDVEKREENREEWISKVALGYNTDIKESVNGHTLIEANFGATLNSADERTTNEFAEKSFSKETLGHEVGRMPSNSRVKDVDITSSKIAQNDTKTHSVRSVDKNNEVVIVVDVRAMVESDRGEGDNGADWDYNQCADQIPTTPGSGTDNSFESEIAAPAASRCEKTVSTSETSDGLQIKPNESSADTVTDMSDDDKNKAVTELSHACTTAESDSTTGVEVSMNYTDRSQSAAEISFQDDKKRVVLSTSTDQKYESTSTALQSSIHSGTLLFLSVLNFKCLVNSAGLYIFSNYLSYN